MTGELKIALSNATGVPIYEQIKDQIKTAIMAGTLTEGEQLPSIRSLARDLRVSVITTSRAFSDLAAEGFVANVQGKGSFVLARDSDLVREHVLREVEEHLEAAARAANLAKVSVAELHTMLDAVLSEDPINHKENPDA
ncbi:GntR family transcriptional regulator [Gephyromycinifex aptenodytis]|uniref:GntR family transcriptional regulator n=1 Tax=Gephyromycinifex aptenodytis TaxID=2716227 RepID=UPI001D021C9A|nr:GntR family transcriptional regulator [Gephyromycinifex aptenodytis]